MKNDIVKFKVRHAICTYKDPSIPEYGKDQVLTGKIIGENPCEFFKSQSISLIETEDKSLFIVGNDELIKTIKTKVKIWRPIKSKPNLKFKYSNDNHWIYKNESFIIQIIPYYSDNTFVCDLYDKNHCLICTSDYQDTKTKAQDTKTKAFNELMYSLEKSKKYFDLINNI